MPNSILLVGFEKNIVTSLTSLFPEVAIKAAPSDFSYDDFRCYCGGTHCIFINGEPSVFLNLIKGKSYIRYPGEGMISYRGDQILNLHSIWELFIERQIFVFGLPNALHLNSLKKIADITGTRVETQPSMDSVSLDIKIEHKDYLAGFFFAQLFNFLPETFTHEKPNHSVTSKGAWFTKSNKLSNSVSLKLQEVIRKTNLTPVDLQKVRDQILKIAQQVKTFIPPDLQNLDENISEIIQRGEPLTAQDLKPMLDQIVEIIQAAKTLTPQCLQSVRDDISEITRQVEVFTSQDLQRVHDKISNLTRLVDSIPADGLQRVRDEISVIIQRAGALTPLYLQDMEDQISSFAESVKVLVPQHLSRLCDAINQNIAQTERLSPQHLLNMLNDITNLARQAKSIPAEDLQNMLDDISTVTQQIAPVALPELQSMLDEVSEFARQVTTEAEEIHKAIFSPDDFNGNIEQVLDNNSPLKPLYPEYINIHLHRWLEIEPLQKPLKHVEYNLEHRDRPVRQIVNTIHGRGGIVFLLPTPESMEDVLLPISAVLDDLNRKFQSSEATPDLREVYRRRFTAKPFPIIGDSAAMQLLYRQIIPVLKDKNGHVLIMGEAGTGKELVANLIKEWQGDVLQSVNCSHLTANIAHSNLFGYVDGAFTGAKKGGKPGYINEQGQGSLFLDEIQALPEEVMPMLLRYLEGGEFVRMGDTKVRKSSIRIIAASNDDQMLHGKFVSSGFISRFRYVIRVPSLKYRLDDIKSLVQYFAEKAKTDLKLSGSATISEQQVEVLKNTDWQHSNVRGLKNAVYNLLARGAQSTTSSDIRSTVANKGAHTEPKPDLPDQETCSRGPKEKISDDKLLDYLTAANDAADLKKKLCGRYQTKSAMWQRINRSDNSEELKRLFDQDKFAKDYPARNSQLDIKEKR